jgi:hypothetical protein
MPRVVFFGPCVTVESSSFSLWCRVSYSAFRLYRTEDSCAFLWCRVWNLAACLWTIVVFYDAAYRIEAYVYMHFLWCGLSYFARVYTGSSWFHLMPRIIFCSLRVQFSLVRYCLICGQNYGGLLSASLNHILSSPCFKERWQGCSIPVVLRIRDPVLYWLLDPGKVFFRIPYLGSQEPNSYFWKYVG